MNPNRNRILLRKLVWCGVQIGNATLILSHVCPNSVCGWAIVVNRGRAGENDQPLLAFLVRGIEMQRYIWVFLNVFDLMGFGLAEDQERIIFPNEPDWLRLGRT